MLLQRRKRRRSRLKRRRRRKRKRKKRSKCSQYDNSFLKISLLDNVKPPQPGAKNFMLDY